MFMGGEQVSGFIRLIPRWANIAGRALALTISFFSFSFFPLWSLAAWNRPKPPFDIVQR